MNKPSARPRATDSASVVPVIKTVSLVGRGTNEDPCRSVTRYWSVDGKLLAENDPYTEVIDSASSTVSDMEMK